MAPGLPAASASATVTRPSPSIASSRARRNSLAGTSSVPAGRKAAKVVPSVLRLCAGGGMSAPS
eukprot:561989-Pleurochrysis_carterae.AAC.1